MTDRLETDRGQLADFIRAIFRHAGKDQRCGSFAGCDVQLRMFERQDDGGDRPFGYHKGAWPGATWDPENFSELMAQAVRWANSAANAIKPVVFAPPLALFDGLSKGGDKDIVQGLALTVDLDGVYTNKKTKAEHQRDPQDSLRELVEMFGPPTLLIESGSVWVNPTNGNRVPKLHAHWRWARPPTRNPKRWIDDGQGGLKVERPEEEFAELVKAKRVRERAAEIACGDPSSNSSVHPIRWPGSWNVKDKANPVLCRIKEINPDIEIEVEDALRIAEAKAAEMGLDTRGKANGHGGDSEEDDKQDADAIFQILDELPNDNRDYANWLPIIIAAKRGGGEEVKEAARVWSAKSEKHNDEKFDKAWDSVDEHDSGQDRITIATLYYEAKLAGIRLPHSAPTKSRVDSYYAYEPKNKFLDAATGLLCSVEMIKQRIGKQAGRIIRDRTVNLLTWAPGRERGFIPDKLVLDDEWVDEPGKNTFNLFRPAIHKLTGIDGTIAAANAKPWIDFLREMYPKPLPDGGSRTEADHIITASAYKAQHPGEKINHALVMGGAQRIGKDFWLKGLRHTVGAWNFNEVTPMQLMGRFNGFLRCLVLRVNEMRDQGNDFTRWEMYEHTKIYVAAPPDTLRIDEKNTNEYTLFNVCLVIYTTNHRTDGLYLAPGDERHFVTWSETEKDDFDEGFFREFLAWYRSGGFAHVAEFLLTLDCGSFDPGRPPPKTEAWQEIIDTARGSYGDELDDVIEGMERPDVLTVEKVSAACAAGNLYAWLMDPKNCRAIPGRLAEAGYVKVPNPGERRGRWRFRSGERSIVYARKDLPPGQRIKAAREASGDDSAAQSAQRNLDLDGAQDKSKVVQLRRKFKTTT